jgi:hypothetical protein
MLLSGKTCERLHCNPHHPHHLIPPLIDHLDGDPPVFARLEGERDAAGELVEQVLSQALSFVQI